MSPCRLQSRLKSKNSKIKWPFRLKYEAAYDYFIVASYRIECWAKLAACVNECAKVGKDGKDSHKEDWVFFSTVKFCFDEITLRSIRGRWGFASI